MCFNKVQERGVLPEPFAPLSQMPKFPMQHLLKNGLSPAGYDAKHVQIDRYDLTEVSKASMDAVGHANLDETELRRPDKIDDASLCSSMVHAPRYHSLRTPQEHGHDVLSSAIGPAEPDVPILFMVRLRRIIQ